MSVFRIRIRPDPTLLGLKDLDPKFPIFWIRIRLRIRILLFFTQLRMCF